VTTYSSTADQASFIYDEWHRRARTRDTDGLVSLYRQNATLESPLVPRILHQPTGLLTGREAIERFLSEGAARRPSALVRWHRDARYLWDGKTLVWEYPRVTPSGDQIDIAEVMDLDGDRIAAHRIYWGWFGTETLLANAREQR
jgi:hypothetical protein